MQDARDRSTVPLIQVCLFNYSSIIAPLSLCIYLSLASSRTPLCLSLSANRQTFLWSAENKGFTAQLLVFDSPTWNDPHCVSPGLVIALSWRTEPQKPPHADHRHASAQACRHPFHPSSSGVAPTSSPPASLLSPSPIKIITPVRSHTNQFIKAKMDEISIESDGWFSNCSFVINNNPRCSHPATHLDSDPETTLIVSTLQRWCHQIQRLG